MAAATKLVKLGIARLGDPEHIITRVNTPVSATGTSIVLTTPLIDDAGVNLVAPLILGITYASGDYKGYTENVYVSAIDTAGTTITVTRGIERTGSDYTTGNANLAKPIPKDSVVKVVYSVQQQEMLVQSIQGDIGTGKYAFRVGDGTDQDIKYYAQNADTNKPYLKYDKTSNKWVMSNDGTTEIDLSTGGVSSAGNGIDIAAGEISVELGTDPGLEFVGTGLEVKVTGAISKGASGIDVTESALDYASQAEAEAGTATDKPLNSLRTKQAIDARNTATIAASSGGYGIKQKAFTTSFNSNTASGTINIAHGLSVVPKYAHITIDGWADNYPSHSVGFSDGTNFSCVYASSFTSGTTSYTAGTSASYSAKHYRNNDYAQDMTITFDATNVKINNTRSGSGSGTTIYVHIIVFY